MSFARSFIGKDRNTLFLSLTPAALDFASLMVSVRCLYLCHFMDRSTVFLELQKLVSRDYARVCLESLIEANQRWVIDIGNRSIPLIGHPLLYAAFSHNLSSSYLS